MDNQLIFLGTGTSSGVPVLGCGCEVCTSADPRDNRLRTSALYTGSGGEKILIDVGPDFRQQSIRHQITRVDAALITHSHQDHIGGIDDLRQVNFLMKKPVTVYANELALSEIRNRFDYIFKETQMGGGKPQINLNLASGPFRRGGIVVEPLQVIHGQLPILGYRINDLAYITDGSSLPQATVERLKGLKVLVINALRWDSHPTHFSIYEALDIVEKVKPERAYFIHLTHHFLHARDSLKLPPHVQFASDGLTLEW